MTDRLLKGWTDDKLAQIRARADAAIRAAVSNGMLPLSTRAAEPPRPSAKAAQAEPPGRVDGALSPNAAEALVCLNRDPSAIAQADVAIRESWLDRKARSNSLGRRALATDNETHFRYDRDGSVVTAPGIRKGSKFDDGPVEYESPPGFVTKGGYLGGHLHHVGQNMPPEAGDDYIPRRYGTGWMGNKDVLFRMDFKDGVFTPQLLAERNGGWARAQPEINRMIKTWSGRGAIDTAGDDCDG